MFVSMFMFTFIVGCSDNESSVSEQNPFPKEPELPFSRLLTNQKFYSSILGADVTYAVLLPEGYNVSKDDYPVVYLFHGFGDKENAWYANGSIQYYSDQYKGAIVPMIFVMPSANNSYYANRYNGRYPYMDMLTKDMVPEIDKLFRTKSNKKYRAAMGYSMGGYGALILPALNPNVFSVGVPLSMSFRTDAQYVAEPQNVFDIQWSPIFGGVGSSGQSRLTDYYKQHSPFHFFGNQPAVNFTNLKLLIDCGDDEESLSITNDKLHTVLRDLNISHEYRVRTGGHSFTYWKQSYPEALKFISDAFQDILYSKEPDPAVIGTLITETNYDIQTIVGHNVNVLKNNEYANATTTSYPVIYVLHDKKEQPVSSKLSMLSLLNNAMNTLNIPKSIIVEIPFADNLTTMNIKDIVTYVDTNYRTLQQKNKRAVVGNSKGGLKAAQFVNEESAYFNACFLFSANLTNANVVPNASTFYYLDLADDSEEYLGYHNMYLTIREQNIGYEYRVRQGKDPYQSFINGLSNSFSTLTSKL
jgi:enterochelin esterase-like enzyme